MPFAHISIDDILDGRAPTIDPAVHDDTEASPYVVKEAVGKIFRDREYFTAFFASLATASITSSDPREYQKAMATALLEEVKRRHGLLNQDDKYTNEWKIWYQEFNDALAWICNNIEAELAIGVVRHLIAVQKFYFNSQRVSGFHQWSDYYKDLILHDNDYKGEVPPLMQGVSVPGRFFHPKRWFTPEGEITFAAAKKIDPTIKD